VEVSSGRPLIKLIVGATLAMVLLAATPLPTPTLDQYSVFSDCDKYFPHYACQIGPDIGRWLPRFGYAWDLAREEHAPRITLHDYFIYGPRPKKVYPLATGWASGGSFFTYGNAGPPRGHVIYDRRHKIAFYNEGCCSWHTTVAAIGIAPPPKRVVDRDLSALHTKYGVRLGDSPARIKSIYGRGTLWSIPGHPGFQRLLYSAPLPPPPPPMHNACGLTYQFIFKHGRLIYIEMLGGC
jgi:hypothetical protein